MHCINIPVSARIVARVSQPKANSSKAASRYPPPILLVTEQREGEISETRMELSEVRNLRPEDVDLQIDEVHRVFHVKRRDGLHRFDGNLPHIGGERGLPRLLDLMFTPGTKWGCRQFGRFPIWQELVDVQSRAAQVYRWRLGLDGYPGTQHFIETITDPCGVGWNAERSWRLIEPLAELSAGASGGEATATARVHQSSHNSNSNWTGSPLENSCAEKMDGIDD